MTRPAEEERSLTLHVELTEILSAETGLNEALASQFAAAVLRGLQRLRGGDELYVPKGQGTARRDAEVRAAFRGNNREEVCRRFGISRRTFYRIVGRRGK